MQSLRRSSWRSLLQSERASRGKRPLTHPRPFSHNCQLLLSRIPQRTQLPYLHSKIRQGGQQFQIRFFRLFTIREPKTLREAGVTFVQVGIVCFTAYGLWKVAEWGITQETLERRQPTPREYSWTTRVNLREALGEEEAGTKGGLIPNWKTTGNKFLESIERLEDRNKDGQGIRGVLGEDEDIFVAGVGRTGLDVSACSEPWRRGYYQALMGAGRCAERLDGWVRDRTRGILFPEKYIVGPSYPTPQPVPLSANAVAPREEDCDPAFESPQKYYLKVITTRGFSVGQRLRAALAYADWLRYKGLNDAAQGMHTWAVDIALEGWEGERNSPIDNETGVFKSNTTTLTPNLLLAAESFGTHFALTGNMAAALPVFLSILRTQQNLPSAPPPEPTPDDTTVSPYWETIRSIVLPPKYPAPPPTGNDLLTQTPDNACASTSTMAHIGEVLFASDLAVLSLDATQLSSDRPHSTAAKSNPFAQPGTEPTKPTSTQSAGLAWTRQATDVAEATLRALNPDSEAERYTARNRNSSTITQTQRAERKRIHEQQKHCAACLTLALDNWVQMVERFERAEQQQTRARLRPPKPVDRAAQQQQAQDVRKMMSAAYQKGANPEEVLAKAEEAVRIADATAEQAREGRRDQAQQVEPTAGGKGWGMFWSSKLGLTPEPEETKAVVEEGKGPWEREAAKVRARRWEARLLRRQLGLED